MNFLDNLMDKIRGTSKMIILPEGQDRRIRQAAFRLAANEICRIVVLTTEQDRQEAEKEGIGENHNLSFHDYLESPYCEQLIHGLHQRRQDKGWSLEQCREKIRDRLYFAAMMVAEELGDGLVAGSIASTSHMLRAAFHCIGTATGIKTGSSCFAMDLAAPTPAGDQMLIYADCAVNPEPGPEELADIAIASAKTHRALLGQGQRVAFLSFSTNGSASHRLVEKISRATAITRERVTVDQLDIQVDGELQADAAIIPEVAKAKCPDSPLAGKANILIFPDLQAGNICYKLTERLAGATAYGPILQGLARPVNDLSRGCRVDDIIGVVAITACQAL